MSITGNLAGFCLLFPLTFITILREETTISLNWFSYGSSILVELEFGDAGFKRGRKTGLPKDKPWEQGEKQQ